jgi:hypothetical protein
MKRHTSYLLALAGMFASLSTLPAQTSAFTYQGRLNLNGSAASGSYDFRFRLASDPAGNSYVGSPFATNAVPVSGGLFTVSIDFGAGLLNGTSYWLEVDVRTNGSAGYANLNPLQAITPAPYAAFAYGASNLSGTLPASQLTGAIPASQLSGIASSATNFTGALKGDVTGTQGATVVSAVSGQTAASVAAAVQTVNAATSAATVNTLAKRDANGSVSAASLTLSGNLYLPATTAGAGAIYSGGIPFVHAYGSYNFFAGALAGNLTLHGTENTGVGYSALAGNNSGAFNTATGFKALFNNSSGIDNVADGESTLLYNTTGSDNTAVGDEALLSNNSGLGNTAVGSQALWANTTGSKNVAGGYQALANNTTVSGLTAVGYQALYQNTSGSNNVAVGYQALSNNLTGCQNTAVGYEALLNNTNGLWNTACGHDALACNASGSANTAMGCFALAYNTNGTENTAIGEQALVCVRGSDNIALGQSAGWRLGRLGGTNNNNIEIGNFGNEYDNNVIRIGTPGTHQNTYIAGAIQTTTNIFMNDHDIQFRNDLNHGLGWYGSGKLFAGNNVDGPVLYGFSGGILGTVNSGNVTNVSLFWNSYGQVTIGLASGLNPLVLVGGAYCTGAQWVNACDRNLKEDFQPADPRAILEKVAALPVMTWHYKTETASVKHLGPTAQDFKGAFELGDSDKSIGTIDEGGVALAAIQGLNQKLNEKDAEIQKINARLEKLESLLNRQDRAGQ